MKQQKIKTIPYGLKTALYYALQLSFPVYKDYKCQSYKMFKHTQAIRRLTPDELFECV